MEHCLFLSCTALSFTFDKKEIRDQYLIVKDGQLAGMGAHSYSKGSATGGSEEAAKYKKK